MRLTADNSAARQWIAGKGLLAFALLTVALLTVAPQSQARVVIDAYGEVGTLGGQFDDNLVASGIAVNSSGAGGVAPGTVYVGDGNNDRIQRFSPDGDFERLWGWDVVSAGGSGDVSTDAFEICTVAAECQDGLGSKSTANGGLISGPEGLAVNQTTGHVYLFDRNRRLTEFDADGNFVRLWGWDVVTAGGSGDVSTDAFEICTVAAECQDADSGANGGQFGPNGRDPIIDATGDIWIPEGTSNRIQRFTSAGEFVAIYGWDVDALGGSGELESCTSTAPGSCRVATEGSAPGQFSGLNPTSIAFDSAGNLHAIDAGNERVQVFDPTLTSATEFSAFAPAGSKFSTTAVVAAIDDGDALAFTNVISGPVQEFDLAGNQTDASIGELAGDADNPIKELAFDESSDLLYVLTNIDGRKVLALGEAPVAPVPTLDPITTFTSDTADFEGTVDPMGAPVECTFQYSTDQVEWTDLPDADCASLDPEGGPQAISEQATGLDPIPYFVRLRVQRLFDASTAVFTPERQFVTESVPPGVAKVGTYRISDTTATLVASVNPFNEATVYRFEYGTQGPCSSSPCTFTPARNLPAGTFTPEIVSEQIEGLESDTTYHLRLIASNGVPGSPTESPDVTFTTRAEPLPVPGGRAFEQVSPPDKNGGAALVGATIATVAQNGQAVGFCTNSLFGEPPSPQSFQCSDYVSRRSSGGWQTRAVHPPFCGFDTGDPEAFEAGAQQDATLSMNLDKATIGQPESAACPFPLLDPLAPLPQKNLYMESLTGASPDYELLAPAPADTPGHHLPAGNVQGSSDDFSHVVYASSGQQVAGAPAGAFSKLYEWHDGALRLVSRDTANAPLATASEVPDDGANGVSSDGSRIYFHNPTSGAAKQLYMREAGVVTHDVSASECTSSCGAGAADTMLYATPDGERALISSAAKLTDDDLAGTDLFLYTHSPDPASEQNLTLLSADEEPGDGNDAGAIDVLGASDDGSVVFFVAAGQIVAGAPLGAGPKLYRWSDGGGPSVEHLATLSASGQDEFNWVPPTAGGRFENRIVTPDGAHLLIHTTVALDPVVDQDADRDIYRWGEEEGWACVSCQFPGEPSAGDASIVQEAKLNGSPIDSRHLHRRIVISDDGERVFFTAADALAPEDASPFADVYEWHEGTIGLVSSGTDTKDAILLGAGRDGKDVFFYTEARLVGWDTDSAGDLYDARLGGGLPEPEPEEATCEGEACRGGGSAAPSPLGAGTAAFVGPPNPAAGKGGPRDCRALARRVRRQAGAAKALRARARRAQSPGQAKRLRRKARRFARAAKKNANRAKRCRRANRRAGR